MSVQTVQELETARSQQFQFSTNKQLLKSFSGKTVESMEVCEVASTDLAPVALRLRILFSDGSYLEVDRKSTEIPGVRRKVLHLNVVSQSN